MIKRILSNLWALAILAWAAPALAQPVNLPPSTVYGRLGISAGPGQAIPFSTLKAQIFNTAGPTTFLDTITITPPALSTEAGLNITQTSPTTTQAGPVNLNTIDTTFSIPTITGSGRDIFGSLNSNAYGFRVNSTLAGSFGGASAYSGFISAMRITGSGGTAADKIAMVGTVYVNTPVTSGGGIAGNANWVFIDSAGSITSASFLEGYESDTGIAAGGSAPIRVGISIWNTGAVRGSTLDAAISVTSIFSGGEFQKFVSFASYANNGTLPSLASNADIFSADQAMTIANVFSASNWTVTGSILNFPGISLAGDATLSLTKNSNSPFTSTITNSAAGTGTVAQFVASNGTNTMTSGIGGTGNANALYTGRGFVTGNGAALVVGTSSLNPTIFAINNLQVASLDSSAPGQLTLGVSGAFAGQMSLVNLTSGTLILKPPAGALGSSVVTVPAVTGTLMTKDSLDTMLNKTYDTAGAGNSFLINGVAVTANTGTGSVVRATSPSISGLTVTGSLTATGLVGNAALVNPSTTIAGQTCTLGSTCGLSVFFNAIGADVALNNTANFFDGPSAAQGTTGTFDAKGTVTLLDSGGGGLWICKLWDGTTVISSSAATNFAGGATYTMALSGKITSPVANIRISCKNTGTITGKIVFNSSGTSLDSTVTATRTN